MALVEEAAACGSGGGGGAGEGGAGGGGGGGACAADDPEALLNEWLGELTLLTAGLQSGAGGAPRPLEIVAPRIDTYRFSMATLEETQDADLDAILGELSALDAQYDRELTTLAAGAGYSSSSKNAKEGVETAAAAAGGAPRAHSPDNDSAFSDTVSMLSGESSASSGASSKCKELKLNLHQNQKDPSFQQKTEKIRLALERMREASVRKLFMKAFSADGSSKSLLVDEKMSCGAVARLLADKNHVVMEPRWALVEQLPDLHMERVYEDHELLVDNLMLWTRESKNKVLFAERPDKISMFQTPEKYLLPEDDRGRSSEQDEHSRLVIVEEFFGGSSGGGSVPASVAGHAVPAVEGPLYLKNDSKKGWKKYHFVLRPSGLYYFPKEKVKALKELVCLASFDTNEVYLGVNWKKKYKSPTDFCFAIKHPRLQQPKSVKFIKFLCADDQQSLERWIVAMRIAKHGRQLLDNYRGLVEELAQEDLDHLAHARSCSITSIPNKSSRLSAAAAAAVAAGGSPASQSAASDAGAAHSDISSGRHSRASSSSSSGCMSDGGATSESTFDCEFPMGTIKRKPSMKPNIPLTWMTRQLMEMAEKEPDEDADDGGTLTRRPRARRAHPAPAAASAPSPTTADHGATLVRQCSSDHDTCDAVVYNIVGSSLPAISSPETIAPAASYDQYETVLARESYRNTSDNASSLYGYTSIYEGVVTAESVEDLPLPPPPSVSAEHVSDSIYGSTLSLESLPPPPPPLDAMPEELSDSQLSLPPPPPPVGRVQDIVAQLSQRRPLPPPVPRRPSLDSLSSRASSAPSDNSVYAQPPAAYGACLVEMQAKKLTPASPSPQRRPDALLDERKLERGGSVKRVVFADEVPRPLVDTDSAKKNKKISFASNGEEDRRPASPRKPPPPKRNESTRLSSPRKLADSESDPPKDFLKDLQRVMRKKWQVAQKCKSDVTMTPHEVLGFREYPLSEEYKETSVSMWVEEHYGSGGSGSAAEEVYAAARGSQGSAGKPPPPAPPRRSESTHLSHAHAHRAAALQPSAS